MRKEYRVWSFEYSTQYKSGVEMWRVWKMMKSERRSWELGAGSWELETGDWRLETEGEGGERREERGERSSTVRQSDSEKYWSVGGWRLEVGAKAGGWRSGCQGAIVLLAGLEAVKLKKLRRSEALKL